MTCIILRTACKADFLGLDGSVERVDLFSGVARGQLTSAFRTPPLPVRRSVRRCCSSASGDVDARAQRQPTPLSPHTIYASPQRQPSRHASGAAALDVAAGMALVLGTGVGVDGGVDVASVGGVGGGSMVIVQVAVGVGVAAILLLNLVLL